MMSTDAPDAIYACGNRFPELYTCKKCFFRTDLHIFLNKHHQWEHQISKPNFDYQPQKHFCQECRFTSYSLLQYFRHQCKKWYKCGKCSFITQKVKSLRAHWRTIHGLYSIKCDECSYECCSQHALKSHRKVHNYPKERKRFKCDQCAFRGREEEDVAKHSKVHLKLKDIQWFRCVRCNFKTRLKCKIVKHTFKHLGKGDKNFRFECDKC